MRAAPRPGFLTGLLAVVGGLVVFGTATAAQEVVLPGQVLDAAERPVPRLEVLLHRVTAEGGALIAVDTTGDDGRFELRAPAAAGEPVYFVATRYEGQLTIGPMMRAPFPGASDYIVRVGMDAAAAPAATGGPAAPPPRDGGRTIALITIGGALILGSAILARASRPPERRRLLLLLATLEESRAAGADPAAQEPERSRIVARLRRGPSA